jgi:hypothetical protein
MRGMNLPRVHRQLNKKRGQRGGAEDRRPSVNPSAYRDGQMMAGVQDDRRGWLPPFGLGTIAAARLPVLGPWPALRSGSACPRVTGVL